MAAIGGPQQRPMLLADLRPFMSDFVVTATLISKSKIYLNAEDANRDRFMARLMDGSGEAHAIGWGSGCNIHPAMEVGKTYEIRGARVNPANPRFVTDGSRIQVVFIATTCVRETPDQTPARRYPTVV